MKGVFLGGEGESSKMSYDPTAQMTPIENEKNKISHDNSSKCFSGFNSREAIGGEQNAGLFP